jgi:hypothetical protein
MIGNSLDQVDRQNSYSRFMEGGMRIKNLFSPSRRTLLIAVGAVVFAAILGLVILSPFALATLTGFRRNWSQLSNIGQTYGAVSALLSSLAIAGVVVSLLYQARDSQTAREQTTRAIHHDLIKMMMEDPALMTAIGAPWGLPIPAESAPIREFLYIRMWVTFLGGNYIIGETSDSSVRYFASHELFRSRAGRDYWAAARHEQLAGTRGRNNRFYRLLDDEYRKAMAGGAAVAGPVKMSDTLALEHASVFTNKHHLRQLGLVAASAAIIGGLIGRFVRLK